MSSISCRTHKHIYTGLSAMVPGEPDCPLTLHLFQTCQDRPKYFTTSKTRKRVGRDRSRRKVYKFRCGFFVAWRQPVLKISIGPRPFFNYQQTPNERLHFFMLALQCHCPVEYTRISSDCVALDIDSNLHRGRFWAMSTASMTVRLWHLDRAGWYLAMWYRGVLVVFSSPPGGG